MPDRASVHDLVHFSVGICVTSCTGHWIHAVFVAEFFQGCCGLLLNGRETVNNIFIDVYSNTSGHLLSGLTFTSSMYRLCSNPYIILRISKAAATVCQSLPMATSGSRFCAVFLPMAQIWWQIGSKSCTKLMKILALLSNGKYWQNEAQLKNSKR